MSLVGALNLLLQLAIARMKEKIARHTDKHAIEVENEIDEDMHEMIKELGEKVTQENSEGSFLRLFWQQQKEAASRPGRGRRWHPMMVRWCIYLRHQSSKAYDTLRESGCVLLPSQRTLRDYTNCVKASSGFSYEVDMLLMKAASIPTCDDWQKLVILLLDEMHIKEDLVYNKHTGQMIGFTNLGEMNNHLLAFE